MQNQRKRRLLEWLLRNFKEPMGWKVWTPQEAKVLRETQEISFSVSHLYLWVSVSAFFHPGNQHSVFFNPYVGLWQLMVTKFTYCQFQIIQKEVYFAFSILEKRRLLVAHHREILSQSVHSGHRKVSIIQIMSASRPCDVKRDMCHKQEIREERRFDLAGINNRFLIQIPPWQVKLMCWIHYYPPIQPYLLKERARDHQISR